MINFIDDYIAVCCVYLLKNKSQAFETCRNDHLWIQNEAQSNFGSLRNDNGREYTSSEFENYLC